MGIVDSIKKGINERIVSPVKAKQAARESAKHAAAVAMRKKRTKYGPIIKRAAKSYRATVDLHDDHARVYKTVDGEDRSVNIPYGMATEAIKNKFDRAFLTESLSKRAVRGAKVINQTIKAGSALKNELKKSGLGKGGMWDEASRGGGTGGSSSLYGDPRNIYR